MMAYTRLLRTVVCTLAQSLPSVDRRSGWLMNLDWRTRNRKSQRWKEGECIT